MNQKFNQSLTRTIFKISLVLSTGGLLISCNANADRRSQALEIQEDININQDSVDAIKKVIEIGENYQTFENNFERSLNNNYPKPVSFRELIEYLPQSPRDWTAEKPEGQTTSFNKYTVSQVKQSYFQKDKTITISIFDCKFNSALYMPFLLSTEFSQESTEGYSKGIRIGNIPGRENYNHDSGNGGLNLLINRRFFVRIDGNNIEEKELREWWEIIDHKSLAKIK